MFRVAALIALAIATPVLADPALNTDVRQDTLATTVCSAGYTRTIRPPVNYTNSIKLGLLRNIGEADEAMSQFELDHVIPLALGGHPMARTISDFSR